MKPLVSNNKTKLRTNSTKSESYSKISNSARFEVSHRQPYTKIRTTVVPLKDRIIKSHINNKLNSTLNKPFEDLSKIQSLKQLDYLPELVSRDDMKKSLLEFEKKYNTTSEKFYSDYKQGKAVDNLDTLKWAILYELWIQKYLMQT